MGLIRTLLALFVVEFHSLAAVNSGAWPIQLPNGIVAVQCFYVISGFYMQLVLSERYAGQPKAFYWARALRIFPAYWIVLLATIGLDIIHRPTYVAHFVDLSSSDPLGFVWALFTNIFLIGQDWSLFIPYEGLSFGQHYNIVSPAWTLGLELTFYAMAPFLARRSTWFLLAIILASMVARHFVYRAGFYLDPWSYRFFPFEIAWFLAGMLCFRVYNAALRDAPKVLGVMALIAFLIFVFAYRPAIDNVMMLRRGGYHVDLVQFALIALLPLIFLATRNSRLDALIGELSYPIYLCHFMILQFLIPPGPQAGIVVTALTLIFAMILAITVRPLESYRLGVRELERRRTEPIDRLGTAS